VSRRTLAALFALAGLALGAFAAHASATPHGLMLGVTDDSLQSSNPLLREEWTARAQTTGADLVLLNAVWSSIAPRKRTAGFEPANPADPAYDWADLDAAVRGAQAAGLRPVIDIDFAPSWAEGPNRPSLELATEGSWLPSPQELGLFSTALATRYSGSFVDPADPPAGPLPHVRYFQVWAEQNIWVHFNPLWEGARMVAPTHYRAMLNAAYGAIHAADPGARVILGGLSPYGDAQRGARRIPPVWFWRALLCLRGTRLRPVRCPHPAHFDIAAHNPIEVGGPGRHAISPLDVSMPDIGRLTAILRRAVATRRVLPARPKPFWATEIWWDTNPPDPEGVPKRRHARFFAKGLFELWRQGVDAAIWWYLRDQAPSNSGGYALTLQSGLFFRDGRAKLAYRVFRFPFVAGRERSGKLVLWGKAPSPGRLVVERRTRRGWVPLAHPVAGQNRIFLAKTGIRGGFRLRARQDGVTSVPWRVR
jgi:hypothetical protein